MQSFWIMFNQMLFLGCCIIIGFILRKTKLLPEHSEIVVSKIENTVCVPALILSITFGINDISLLTGNIPTLLYSSIVVLMSCIIGFYLAPLLTKNPKHIGIFRYSLTFTNFGFMGQSLIQGVFGEEMLYSYFIFQLPAAIALYTIGIAWLTEKKSKFSWKVLINPTYIAMLVGMIIGFSGIQLPSFLSKTISGLASCYSPLAMIVTGIVIAKYDFKNLFKCKNIYVLTAIRLVLIPLSFLGICKLLNTPKDIVILILTFTSMPLGLYTVIIPAATGGDDTPGASMVLISNIIGLISVPLLFCLVS